MEHKLLILYDEYTHKPLKREVFMSRLAKLTGSLAAAMSVLPMLEASAAYVGQISEDDADLIIEDITYPISEGQMKGYLAKPKSSTGTLGSVIIVHENRGLNAHIKDVARRVAKAGYIALAPDALSPLGGTTANDDENRAGFGKLDMPKTIANFVAGADYLSKRKDSNGKVGCVGFCWGGAMVNNMAVSAPASLKAAVAYYGRQPEAAGVKNIKAKVLLHYGGLDERVNEGIPAYEAALKAAGVSYELYVYEGAQHAFNNDTSAARYNKEVADLAWGRTLKLFGETLK
jgi:carboxymethylenebutenolidase